MAVKYDFYKKNEVQGGESETVMRARAVSRGTITTEQLLKWVSQVNGFKRGETKGILTALTDAILFYLEDGYNVQLGELGYFSISLTSKKVKNRREIRAESVEFKSLNFRASQMLRDHFKYVEKEKVDKPRQSSQLPREKCAQRLNAFLETHPFATRADYCRLTGSLKDKAILDLNTFIAEGWLSRYGQGRTVVYVLNKP